MPDDHAIMSFGDHLDELRKRVILVLLGVVPVMVIGLVFGRPLLNFITSPLLEAMRANDIPVSLLATEALEGINAYLKVSFILTLLLGFPWILYQLWCFIAPGLYPRERRFVYFLLPLSTLLTALGMVFLYTVLLPVSLTFLIGFNDVLVERTVVSAPVPEGVVFPEVPSLEARVPQEAIDNGSVAPGSLYYNAYSRQLEFVTSGGKVRTVPLRGEGAIAQEFRLAPFISLVFTLAIVFSISFQTPVVMLLLHWIGVIEPRDVTPYRRYVLFGCSIAGAVFTPADPVSMIVLGGALYMLFELGIIMMRFVPASLIAGGATGRFDTDDDEG